MISFLVSLGVVFRHVFAWVPKMLAVSFISPALLLLGVAVVEMSSSYGSPAWWPGRWTCSVGLSKLNVSCAVASSCCVSLTFHFKYVISVHAVYSCSPYVKLSNTWDCLSMAITTFCELRKLYPEHSLSLT